MNYFYKKQLILFFSISLVIIGLLPCYNILIRKTHWRQAFDVSFIESKVNQLLYDKEFNFNDEVIITPDFLFLRKVRKNQVIHKHNSVEYASQARLKQDITHFKIIAKHLAENNTPFLLVIPPNKMSVYPEKIPAFIDVKKDNETTKYLLEQLEKEKLPTIYLKDDLVKHKNEGKPLYYKYDTHWNGLGAYYGYQSIITSLNKHYQLDIKPIAVKQIIPTRLAIYDLMLKLRLVPKEQSIEYALSHSGSGKEVTQTDYDLELNKTTEKAIINPVNITPNKKLIAVTNKTALNPQKLLYIRDSFATANITYFQETFTEVWQVANAFMGDTNYIIRLINEIKPDIVIYEKIERDFG